MFKLLIILGNLTNAANTGMETIDPVIICTRSAMLGTIVIVFSI